MLFWALTHYTVTTITKMSTAAATTIDYYFTDLNTANSYYLLIHLHYYTYCYAPDCFN